jgi:hypothetical protein
LCKNYGVEFYFRAEELQKRGVMHIHLFLLKKKGFRIGFLDKRIDKIGLSNIKVIRDKNIDNVTNYMLKYLTKSLKINMIDYKIKNKVKKRIRRYSIWIPKKYRDNKQYKLIMSNNKLEKMCILKDIKIQKEGGYKVIMNNNKILKYKFVINKYVDDDYFELYIDRVNFIFIEKDIILYESYKIENEQDLKEIVELIINLMDLN